MTIVSDVQKAFPELSIPNVSSYYTGEIQKWLNIFENNPPWKKTKRNALINRNVRIINMLNTAKVLCDTFADLTFSEQCKITVNNEQYQKYIDEQLNINGFWKNMPEWISSAYALGGGCIKVYADNGNPKINYIHADKFLPTEWNGKDVIGGIFQTNITRLDTYYTFFEKYNVDKVEYKLFKSKNISDIGNQCDIKELFEKLESSIDYNTQKPMIAYFKPSVNNNSEYDTPLGMSIYANALDTLKSLDITFDSFCREFILGKKRIIVPAKAIKSVIDTENGELVRYFDAEDEAIVAFNTDDAENLKIVDNTANLRVAEHISAINALLNILCFQVGLSAGTLSFDAVQGIKTATEVISQESKTARTVKSNKNLLTETIENVIHSLIGLGQYLELLPKEEYTLMVSWQDNVVIDDNTLIDNNIKLYSAGLVDLTTALMNIHKISEETAKQMAERIKNDSSITTTAIDAFGSDDE